MTETTEDDLWKDLLPSGYRIETDQSMAPDIYVLYRDGQKFEGKPVGHCWPSYARAVCYAHYLSGAIGSPMTETTDLVDDKAARDVIANCLLMGKGGLRTVPGPTSLDCGPDEQGGQQ